MNKIYNSVELFAGAGGLSLGLEQANINPITLNELDKNACQTLRHNRPHWNVIEEDIVKVTEKGIRQYIGNVDIDILSGGYPCQAFSYAGKRLGLEDVRGTMFFYYAKILKELQPKLFIVENVKGLVTHDKGKTLETMINVFSEVGYNVQYKILNALHYNVAQKRERIIIVGTRKDLPNTYTYPMPLDYTLNLKDILKDVPKSLGSTYSERQKKYLSLVPPGGCWVDIPQDKAIEYMGKAYYAKGGKRGYLRRFKWNEPCLTLTCSPAQKQVERCHPDEIRPFTIREYARIQSFPDNWEFIGSISSQYKQIGNAVPPELAKYIGLSIVDYLNKL